MATVQRQMRLFLANDPGVATRRSTVMVRTKSGAAGEVAQKPKGKVPAAPATTIWDDD